MEIMIGKIASVILVVKHFKEKKTKLERGNKNQQNRRTARKYDNIFSSTLEFRTNL